MSTTVVVAKPYTVLLKKILRKKIIPTFCQWILGRFDVHIEISIDPKSFQGVFPRSEPQGSGKAIKNCPRGLKPSKMDSPYPKTYTRAQKDPKSVKRFKS